jgi:hypothetical protein
MKISAETYREYITRLHDLDYKFLGQGAFGTVFEHPTFSNVAVKVVKADSAYKKYAEFCAAHKSNPWLPKIADLVPVKLDDAPRAYIVFMEKLQPVKPEFIDELRDSMISRFRLRRWSETQWFDRASWRKIASETPPAFAVIASYFANNLNSVDLTPSNFMRRGNQLVFNDPMA